MPHYFPMPKVYSYTRFSTPEQALGDSERRQVSAAQTFAAEHGLALDDSLRMIDAGVSAFRGANLKPDAALGRFVELVREGEVEPGSILLLESLDRLSRAEPLVVQNTLTGLLLEGIQVATLSDGRVYSRESLAKDGGMGLMVSLMVAVRAHEESATKGKRVAAAWAEKRRKAREGSAGRLTEKAPTWLVPEDDGWAVNAAKAATVRRVYAMTLEGHGEHAIASTFNREGVPMLGRGKQWHRSSVAKLLRNRAVIGDLTPGHIEHINGRKVRVLEDPIPGAFPAIIDEADWLAVRALKDGATAAVRGKAAQRPLANVLAGLARCPLCGSAMTRVFKGNAGKAGVPKLVCTRAKAGAGCVYKSVALPQVEGAIFAHPELALRDVPAGPGAATMDREAEELEGTIAGTVEHLQDLDGSAGTGRAAAARRARLRQELATLEAALEDLNERRRLVDHGLVRARAERLYSAIEGRQGDDRASINAAMRLVFSGVVVDYRTGDLRFQWKQGGETLLRYAWEW